MTERCDCCDLPVESCGKAIEDRQRKALREEQVHFHFTEALWNGKCAECGRFFAEGDPIRYSVDHSGWVADCCG